MYIYICVCVYIYIYIYIYIYLYLYGDVFSAACPTDRSRVPHSVCGSHCGLRGSSMRIARVEDRTAHDRTPLGRLYVRAVRLLFDGDVDVDGYECCFRGLIWLCLWSFV